MTTEDVTDRVSNKKDSDENLEDIKINQPKDTEKVKIYSTIAFIVVVVGIGFPVWWKTTEVYRVSLPNSQIMSLDHTTISIKSTVFVWGENSEVSVKDLQKKTFPYFWSLNFISIPSSVNAGSVTELVELIEKRGLLKSGDFLVIKWPQKFDNNVEFSDKRYAVVKTTASSDAIFDILNSHVLKSKQMESALENSHSITSRDTSISTKYEIVLTVLIQSPQTHKINFDPRKVAKEYITPFLSKFSTLTNATVKSQWKYQSRIDFTTKKIPDESKIKRHYSVEEHILPNIITSIESKIGSGISNHPVVNLVIYVPPCTQSPLYIYQNGAKAENSFVASSFGGILIYNPEEEQCIQQLETNEPIDVDVSLELVSKAFLRQLVELMNLREYFLVPGTNTLNLNKVEDESWQFDCLLRRNTLVYLSTTIQTLQSLVRLLDGISYIVINDDVGQSIIEANANVRKSERLLKNGHLKEAFEYAKKAYLASEHAFFDYTLLAQLYFPDEQKYAIYIPLFLPVLVPVLSSIKTLKKHFFK
ncbi:PIGS family protein [Megaselia abdita]